MTTSTPPWSPTGSRAQPTSGILPDIASAWSGRVSAAVSPRATIDRRALLRAYRQMVPSLWEEELGEYRLLEGDDHADDHSFVISLVTLYAYHHNEKIYYTYVSMKPIIDTLSIYGYTLNVCNSWCTFDADTMEALNPENINTDPRWNSIVQYMTVPGIIYQGIILTRILVRLR